jgi:hypothetical protein
MLSFPSPHERLCGIGQRKVSIMAAEGAANRAVAMAAEMTATFIINLLLRSKAKEGRGREE